MTPLEQTIEYARSVIALEDADDYDLIEADEECVCELAHAAVDLSDANRELRAALEAREEADIAGLMRELPGALRLRSDEMEAAEAAIDDLNVQCKFWRQAAEHAVKGWNALEDKVEAAKEALDAIEGNLDAARELLGGLDERAPPDIAAAVDKALEPYASYELEPGRKLRIVEDETPIRERLSCGHYSDAHPDARNYCQGAAEREGPVCSLGWAWAK